MDSPDGEADAQERSLTRDVVAVVVVALRDAVLAAF
jgi:hypothetical protein